MQRRHRPPAAGLVPVSRSRLATDPVELRLRICYAFGIFLRLLETGREIPALDEDTITET
jgi:hypothetical protein